MADSIPTHLGILLTHGPGTVQARAATALARAAARRGLKVEVYLMDAGADLLSEVRDPLLLLPGVSLLACTKTVLERGAPSDLEHVDYASQFQLAGIVSRAERFISL